MEFKNRRAQYPGRVKLVKVAGSTDLYDMTLADGSVSGSYEAGTPLNADTFNSLMDEINAAVAAAKLNSFKITDGTNNGTQTIVNGSKDITIRLPSTISANLDGNATSAKAVSISYGSVTIKTVALSTSFTTVYSAKPYASALVIIAPWSGSAKNTAIFAVSNADGTTSVNDITYVNKNGYIKKQWNGSYFQVAMSSSGASGTYSITIIDAHY